MGQQFIRLLAALVYLFSLSSNVWSAAPAWVSLTPVQQNILAPVKLKWASMSDLQRSRLVAVAAKYPQLKPEQQRRFQKRLTTWSSLTREQRELARQNYRKLKRLPPKKQLAVKQKWLQSHQPALPLVAITPQKLQIAP